MEFDKSSIERLKRSLYSRNEDLVPKEKRTPVQASEVSNVPTNFGETPSFDIPFENMAKQNNSFFNKFLLGSFGFFVVALGIAGFVFFGGFNTISSNNVDIQITAPTSVSSGDELPIALSVVNENPTGLEDVTLFITYPTGSQSFEDSDKTLAHDRIDLDSIERGESKDHTVRLLLFGAKDEVKTFGLRLEYKVAGSNAVFSKEKTFDVTIGSSPLLLSVAYPHAVNSGQMVTLTIGVTSNSSALLRNSLVKVEYPFGFTYKESNIKPLRDNSIWNIGDLKTGDKKTLTITGILVGQDLEDRSFRISAGVSNGGTVSDFETALAQNLATIGIRKSFFDLSVSANRVFSIGQSVPVVVKWKNTLPDKIINNTVTVTFSGNALDRSSVSPGNGGFYKSGSNSIVWDKNSTAGLRTMAPGDDGEVSFSVGTFVNPIQINSLRNPHIDIKVTMAGKRSGVETEDISSSENITLKIPSTLSLSAKSYRAIGPLTNSGPIPPRADKETTYTVTWTMTNTTNDLKETSVSGVLPAGVEWNGEVSPVSERISFDENSRTVFWNVGNIAAGAGFTISAKEVSFKVGLTPSVNQISIAPTILSNIEANATDTYTETSTKVSATSLSTRYSDPSFQPLQDIVVK